MHLLVDLGYKKVLITLNKISCLFAYLPVRLFLEAFKCYFSAQQVNFLLAHLQTV